MNKICFIFTSLVRGCCLRDVCELLTDSRPTQLLGWPTPYSSAQGSQAIPALISGQHQEESGALVCFSSRERILQSFVHSFIHSLNAYFRLPTIHKEDLKKKEKLNSGFSLQECLCGQLIWKEIRSNL